MWIELSVLAATRQQPYAEIVPRLAATWLDWIAQRIDVPAEEAPAAAAATLAQIDGALLLELAGLHDVARLAVEYRN